MAHNYRRAFFICGLVLLTSCFWEGRSGLDAAALDFFQDAASADACCEDVVGLDNPTLDAHSPDTALPGDLCQNSSDQAIYADPQIDVDAAVETCATSCGLSPDIAGCTATCVVDATGLSEDCAGCYGGVTGCTMQNCIPACFNAASAECISCRQEHCTPAFDHCTG